VLETLVESAARLCGAESGLIWRFDGEFFRAAADYGVSTELKEFWERKPIRPGRGSVTGRAALERRTVQIPGVLADPEYQLAGSQKVGGYRTLLGVPMLREDVLIGVFGLQRYVAQPFTDKHIELVTTFADQAVIAIENVRLFTELQEKNRAVTEAHAQVAEALEQQTATAEILRVISRSQTDVQPVFDTIVRSAVGLCDGLFSALYWFDGELIHSVAQHNFTPEALEELKRAFPARPTRALFTGRSILECAVVHIADREGDSEHQYQALGRAIGWRSGIFVPMGRAAETREPTQVADIAAPGAYQSHIRATLLGAGYRALLSVPLLREGGVIGSLSLNRHTPGEFPPEAVEILKTFATQSALAIQNARLFREIADKSAQLETASRHKSEFLANMSHELRTPLNAIIGFSEILAEKMFGDINEKQTEYLQDILESGRHLLSLINDILDLSKIEAGRMELELAEFDLPSAIENALILVRERASRRGIRLGSTIDGRLGMIGGDERKVKQVLLNLLSNALKFTPEGGRIDVDARFYGEMVEVSVTDTGIGIAPEDQGAVFEEFRQVGTADKKAEGTGLGLSRKFIELHGGRIWVKSEIGVGSTFTFTLPLAWRGSTRSSPGEND
jgi:signal transduction histidine kinase